MGTLGNRIGVVAIDNSGNNPYGNGMWAATFDARTFAVSANSFEIYHMALTGPAGSSLQVWVDRLFYDATSSGDLNSWDPNKNLRMQGGQTLYFYWSLGSSPTPTVTVWLQDAAIL